MVNVEAREMLATFATERSSAAERVVPRDTAQLACDRGNVVRLRRVHDPVVIPQFDALIRQAAEDGVLQHVAAVLVLEHENQYAIKDLPSAKTHLTPPP